MAIGIVIGVAFSTVVKSLVDDIVTPPIGKLTGGVDFSNLYFNLSGETYESLAAAKAAGAITVNYGLFINSLISFVLVAWALFMVVKIINRLKRQDPPPTPTTKVCPYCKSTIHIEASRCSACTATL